MHDLLLWYHPPSWRYLSIWYSNGYFVCGERYKLLEKLNRVNDTDSSCCERQQLVVTYHSNIVACLAKGGCLVPPTGWEHPAMGSNTRKCGRRRGCFEIHRLITGVWFKTQRTFDLTYGYTPTVNGCFTRVRGKTESLTIFSRLIRDRCIVNVKTQWCNIRCDTLRKISAIVWLELRLLLYSWRVCRGPTGSKKSLVATNEVQLVETSSNLLRFVLFFSSSKPYVEGSTTKTTVNMNQLNAWPFTIVMFQTGNAWNAILPMAPTHYPLLRTDLLQK